MTQTLATIVSSSLFRWTVYLGFAILFYKSGESFTVWLLQPAPIVGASQWVWIALFPVLLPLFFVVNRRFGCASAACRTDSGRAGVHSPPGH
jgi:hypothetical protein